jgi:hypothetical protein
MHARLHFYVTDAIFAFLMNNLGPNVVSPHVSTAQRHLSIPLDKTEFAKDLPWAQERVSIDVFGIDPKVV